MDATVRLPGEGERIGGPNTVTIEATGEETSDSFHSGEAAVEPGFPGPPPHVHKRLHDMFYVLEGTLTMLLGADEVQAAAGTFVCVPPGVVHTFMNRSDDAVRFLNFNTPGGWERYMRDLAAAAAEGGELTPAKIGEIASRYDFRPV